VRSRPTTCCGSTTSTTTIFIALSVDWNESQSVDGRAERRDAIARVCERLWPAFSIHVAQRLESLKLTPGAPVVFLPQGGLGLLPLSAASPDPHSAGSLLDAYAISLAPSLYLLSVMQRRAAERVGAADSFLGVLDPLEDLEYARAEGLAIAALFPEGQVTLLEGKAASGSALANAVVEKKYVHLSCHAFYSTDGGNFAGLYLAHDALSRSQEEVMAVAERRPPLEGFFLAGQRWITLELALAKCRLVTLSACESGRSDVARPDEFLGLPAAFLRAGAAAVIGTTWRVDDIATMLLTRKLYEGLVHEQLSPASALRSAQRWLRDATNRSLVALYGAMRDEANPPLSSQRLERELRRHALGAAKERPFSNPYFWAAFLVYGSEQ
jgi:CHAT domain-containing protein